MRLRRGWGVAGVLASALAWLVPATTGTAAVQGPPQIPSRSEPGEGLAIRQISPRSGRVTFAATEGRGILVSVQANAPAETRARSFIGLYGGAFGFTDQSQLRLARRPEIDALGIEHVRFQQLHDGIPVTAGEFIVHLRGSRVLAANGRTSAAAPTSLTPAVTPAQAIEAARALVERRLGPIGPTQVADPRLEILDRGLLEDVDAPARLAWFLEARGPALRERIWVDAETGGILLHFSQLPHAKDRRIYDAGGTAVLPGTLVRSEGEAATGNAEADAAYDAAGRAYDYFLAEHGRDSWDAAGAQVRASVNWTDGMSCPNAFWDGMGMVLCPGFGLADDIVAHELTHGVTEATADLFYYYQSGALNESFSDIFGESVDLANGDEGTRWEIGEDLPGGDIRHMMSPNLFGHPGRVGDPLFWCLGADAGGVHLNSGVPNHAYALMVDGGTFNGYTIAPIGRTKADRIQYRALTTYLTSGATFLDNYLALNQACVDLVGVSGINAADCTQVRSALDAVQMDDRWSCPTAAAPAPLCPTGAPPATTVFSDTFEAGIGQWTVENPVPNSSDLWSVQQDFATSGTHSAVAFDPANESDQRLTLGSGVLIPAGGRLAFSHSFDFDTSGGSTYFDGGVIEYSTDDGMNWIDAGSLIDAGRGYGGTLDSSEGNPLGGRAAFVAVSFGYTNTRLNLTSLAGETVRVRFRLGSGDSIGARAWHVDDVQIYTCSGDLTGELIQNGSFSDPGSPPSTPPPGWAVFSEPTPSDLVWTTSGAMFEFYRPSGTQGVVLQPTGVGLPAFGQLSTTFTMGNTDTVRKRFSVLVHDSDFSDLSVCTFWLDPLVPAQSYTMRTHTTEAWGNATISFYAASLNAAGSTGAYQLDNVRMSYMPAQSAERTDCLDPAAPAGTGGLTSANLLANGSFATPITPWSTFGNIQWQVSGGVFEFFRLAGDPSGVLLQPSGQAMVNDQKLLTSFQLGNSSGLRQRVTVLLHDADFNDLHACTFYLPPGLPLSTFALRTYVTRPWTNATLSVYPATTGVAPQNQWLRLDNVVLTRTDAAIIGTECFEPGDVPGG